MRRRIACCFNCFGRLPCPGRPRHGAGHSAFQRHKNAINGINSYPGPEFVKYAREREPQDRRIDLFISDWQGSMPRSNMDRWCCATFLFAVITSLPRRKSAVLRAANFFAYGRLAAGASTTPERLRRSAGGLLCSRR